MKTIEVPTISLNTPQINYAVSVMVGANPRIDWKGYVPIIWFSEWERARFATDYDQGYPILADAGVGTYREASCKGVQGQILMMQGQEWTGVAGLYLAGRLDTTGTVAKGPTPLIAGFRALLLHYYGVKIPIAEVLI